MLKAGRTIYMLVGVMVLVSLISLYNQNKFGTLFPMLDPSRIEFNERTYYPTGFEPESFKSELVPIDSSFYWGRGLYVRKDSFKQINSLKQYRTYMSVYLEQSDGKFHRFVISGGP